MIGLLNGLEWILRFSMMHSFRTIRIREIMDNTPNSLEGVILNRLKLTRRYHSGTISNGVDNAFDVHIISRG